ncbi:MAG TPA: hypothetical protein VHI78_05310, partial [Bacteroidales bacterium]|nr:hypothetical protein [Bacteroidales bacterium]
MKLIKIFLIPVILAFISNVIPAQDIKEIFINPNSGNDQNSGSADYPLKSLYEAAERINRANGSGSVVVFLSEGIYGLDATVT